MHDRSSAQPPEIFTMRLKDEEDMENYLKGADTKRSKHQSHASLAQQSTTSTASKSSGIVRFGKSLASAFNPFNVFGKWHPSQEEASPQKDEVKERAEEAYAQLKKSGFKGTRPYESSTVRHNPTKAEDIRKLEDISKLFDEDTLRGPQQTGTVRASVDLRNLFDRDSRQSSVETSSKNSSQRLLFGGEDAVLLSPSLIAGGSINSSASVSPKKSSRHIRRPSIPNLQKMKSHLSLKRAASPAPPNLPVKDHLPDSNGIRSHASSKDLRKQQKLVKRVSDLETQLDAARRKLATSINDTPPPVPSVPSPFKHRQPFTPGRLPTLPSERLLNRDGGLAVSEDGELSSNDQANGSGWESSDHDFGAAAHDLGRLERGTSRGNAFAIKMREKAALERDKLADAKEEMDGQETPKPERKEMKKRVSTVDEVERHKPEDYDMMVSEKDDYSDYQDSASEVVESVKSSNQVKKSASNQKDTNPKEKVLPKEDTTMADAPPKKTTPPWKKRASADKDGLYKVNMTDDDDDEYIGRPTRKTSKKKTSPKALTATKPARPKPTNNGTSTTSASAASSVSRTGSTKSTTSSRAKAYSITPKSPAQILKEKEAREAPVPELQYLGKPTPTKPAAHQRTTSSNGNGVKLPSKAAKQNEVSKAKAAEKGAAIAKDKPLPSIATVVETDDSQHHLRSTATNGTLKRAKQVQKTTIFDEEASESDHYSTSRSVKDQFDTDDDEVYSKGENYIPPIPSIPEALRSAVSPVRRPSSPLRKRASLSPLREVAASQAGDSSSGKGLKMGKRALPGLPGGSGGGDRVAGEDFEWPDDVF